MERVLANLIPDRTARLLRRARRAWQGPEPPSFRLSRSLFLRLLGLVYLVAFVSLGVQVSGLIGADGILPATRFLSDLHDAYGATAYRLAPTVAWVGGGDAFLRVLCWGGAGLAFLLIAGVAPMPVAFLLWASYLSLAVVGQVFLSFQWDALLLETGLAAVLYAPPGWRVRPSTAPRPSPVARWLLGWLLFRLVFLSGVTKLVSGDPTWANLTALEHHYETQPLPTWPGWYVHHLPDAVHRASTVGMFAAELGLPFLVLLPARLRRLRTAACLGLILFQLAIAVTGNYGFFNLLTVVLCLSLLDDRALRRLLPGRLVEWAAGTGPRPSEPRWKRALVGVGAAILVPLSLLMFVREIEGSRPSARDVRAEPGWGDRALAWIAPFRSVNGYGLFRVMTTERPEIVVEASRDGVDWVELEFRWKPGDPEARPRFVAPHMPRLDWQMWFAALSPRAHQRWLLPLLRRLLEGRPDVWDLLAAEPPGGGPPRYVRLVYYRYRFSTPGQKRSTGVWWQRERRGELTPPLVLQEGELRAAGGPGR